MNAAGGDPNLRRHNGCGWIRIEDERQPVRQSFDSGGGGGIVHEILAWMLGK